MRSCVAISRSAYSCLGNEFKSVLLWADRLERLDAEMRKELDELRNERDDYRASLYDETDGITGTLRKDELAEASARVLGR